MNIYTWAARWRVPREALIELEQSLGIAPMPFDVVDTASDKLPLSEAEVQAKVRLNAARKGQYLWRNNVGAGFVATTKDATKDSQFMRWGLANDSKQLNAVVKSSDLIGITKTLVTPDMVGNHVGIFTARETKKSDWQFRGSKEEEAQLRFINLVTAQGGDARFTNGGEL